MTFARPLFRAALSNAVTAQLKAASDIASISHEVDRNHLTYALSYRVRILLSFVVHASSS